MLKNCIIYFYFGVLFIVSSCQRHQTENTKDQRHQTENTKESASARLIPSGIITFNIDQETSFNNYFYDAFTINGEDVLGLVNRNANGVQVYSLTDGKLHKKFKFQESGPDGFPRLRAFTFINPDSIFIINLYAKNLWLVDIDGKIKRKFNALNDNGKPLFNLGAAFYTGVKPLFYKNRLYIQSYSKDVNSSDLTFFDQDNKTEIEIDLESENWKYVNIHYPPFYKGNLWVGDISRDLGKDGKLVYSFGADSNIITYNLADKRSEVFDAQSNFIGNIMPLVKTDDEAAVARYFLEIPRYTNLVYDKYRDVYYRFVRHELESINLTTGSRNTY